MIVIYLLYQITGNIALLSFGVVASLGIASVCFVYQFVIPVLRMEYHHYD